MCRTCEVFTEGEPNLSQIFIVIKQAEHGVSHEAVENLLQKFAIQDFIRLDITD